MNLSGAGFLALAALAGSFEANANANANADALAAYFESQACLTNTATDNKYVLEVMGFQLRLTTDFVVKGPDNGMFRITRNSTDNSSITSIYVAKNVNIPHFENRGKTIKIGKLNATLFLSEAVGQFSPKGVFQIKLTDENTADVTITSNEKAIVSQILACASLIKRQ